MKRTRREKGQENEHKNKRKESEKKDEKKKKSRKIEEHPVTNQNEDLDIHDNTTQGHLTQNP